MIKLSDLLKKLHDTRVCIVNDITNVIYATGGTNFLSFMLKHEFTVISYEKVSNLYIIRVIE